MPIATGVGDGTVTHELVSCPGGFVKIRRLTYGEKMKRKSFMSKMKLNTDSSAGNRAERRSKQAQAFSAELDMMNEEVTQFEFAVSILDHNLTYLIDPANPESEAMLNFKNPEHVKMLDGNVGEEIDDLITNHNDWESGEDEGK
jgi:hypothetical protein